MNITEIIDFVHEAMNNRNFIVRSLYDDSIKVIECKDQDFIRFEISTDALLIVTYEGECIIPISQNDILKFKLLTSEVKEHEKERIEQIFKEFIIKYSNESID